MNIHESAEDYLEAILRLKEAKGYAPVSYTHLTLPTNSRV